MNEKYSEYLCDMYVMRNKSIIKNQIKLSYKTYKKPSKFDCFHSFPYDRQYFPYFSYNNSNVNAIALSLRAGLKLPLLDPARPIKAGVPHSRPRVRHQVHSLPRRFTEEQPTHAYSEKQKSTEKLPPMPQEKPKNPFRANLEECFLFYAEIIDSIASYSPRKQSRIRLFLISSRRFEEGTLEPSKISIKIQRQRTSSTPN
jgi:hypothetical protein